MHLHFRRSRLATSGGLTATGNEIGTEIGTVKETSIAGTDALSREADHQFEMHAIQGNFLEISTSTGRDETPVMGLHRPAQLTQPHRPEILRHIEAVGLVVVGVVVTSMQSFVDEDVAFTMMTAMIHAIGFKIGRTGRGAALVKLCVEIGIPGTTANLTGEIATSAGLSEGTTNGVVMTHI